MNKEFLKNKIILITGGTGTFGYEMTKQLLKIDDIVEIRILSRNEEKQYKMRLYFNNHIKIKYMIGDIRDKERLDEVFKNVNIIYHASAMKHVPIVEENAVEAIKTNIIGTMNVIEMAKKNKVEKLIGISTDKAVSPYNLYGKTKATMEDLMKNENNKETHISLVRYGNVFGSSGSVIPIFINQIQKNKDLTITEPDMTRFTISIENAIKLVLDCTELMIGGEIFIPKLKKYTISNLVELLKNNQKKDINVNIIGRRKGEKKHELMISEVESEFAIDYKDYYVIIPEFNKMYIEKYGDTIYGINKIYSSANQEEINQVEFDNNLYELLNN